MTLMDMMPVIVIVALLGASFAYYTLRTGVPTFPSMPVAREKIIALLQADMAVRRTQGKYKIYDLGSGSGQLSWHIARALPEAEVVGIELSFLPWLRATVWQKLTGQRNLRYLRVDFWSMPVRDADAVLTYLMEAIMPRVAAKLRAELRPRTLVICNKFALPGWQPEQTLPLQSAFSKRLLVYRQESALMSDTDATDATWAAPAAKSSAA